MTSYRSLRELDDYISNNDSAINTIGNGKGITTTTTTTTATTTTTTITATITTTITTIITAIIITTFCYISYIYSYINVILVIYIQLIDIIIYITS